MKAAYDAGLVNFAQLERDWHEIEDVVNAFGATITSVVQTVVNQLTTSMPAPSASVSDERSAGAPPTPGSSTSYSCGDHTHGSAGYATLAKLGF